MAKTESFTIDIKPSDRIFRELGNNAYDFLDLLSELIDNSIAARVEGIILDVRIEIRLSEDRGVSSLTIRDNASGIPRDRLAMAITPAGLAGKTLNEHGLGMKQAVATLGSLSYLKTKLAGDERAMVVHEFKFGPLKVDLIEVDWDHGTEIRVDKLKPIVHTNPLMYERHVIQQLGARYRRFLRPDNPSMALKVEISDADDADKVVKSYAIQELKPVYFHPSTATNAPVINKKVFQGTGWMAELTFGYAPEEKEYEDLGLPVPAKWHPYRVTLDNQGLDILRFDRVVNFHQLSQIGLVDARHPSFNRIRGEIDLKSGFVTAITKNKIIEDAHFGECRDQIKSFLESKDYLYRKHYPEELPESLLRDRLAKWLRDNTVAPRKKVHIEYGVQGLDGKIDVFADDEIFELKRQEAYGLDVYQLFAYLDMGKLNKGHLVAPSFRPSASAAAEHIKTAHHKEILLDELSMYPIGGPMTAEEREQYG